MNPSKRGRTTRRTGLAHLQVHTRPRSHRAVLMAAGMAIPCTIGKTGATRGKREGDGCTPRGKLRTVAWYAPPGPGRLPWRGLIPKAITPKTGWCDDPESPAYNRPVKLPATASHESMARTDGKYDIVGVLDWNVCPRVRARGSAIFFHINDDPARGTEGCIALTRMQMRRLLPRLARRVVFTVR